MEAWTERIQIHQRAHPVRDHRIAGLPADVIGDRDVHCGIAESPRGRSPTWHARFTIDGDAVRGGAIASGGSMNAYPRHLAAHGEAHSGGRVAALTDERFRAKYARAKRC